MTRPVAQWLERQLDLPNWTGADIAAMPVTHISEWARANGVELDRNYSSEEREKDRLIYESWLKAARAELSPEPK